MIEKLKPHGHWKNEGQDTQLAGGWSLKDIYDKINELVDHVNKTDGEFIERIMNETCEFIIKNSEDEAKND